MRVALVTHAFPSAHHPYIHDWAAGLIEAGLDLWIVTERCEEGKPRAYPLAPSVQTRILKLNPPRGLPVRARALWKTLAGAATFRWRRSYLAARAFGDRTRTALRKAWEYLALDKGGFDVVHFNAPQIARRRLELGAILGGRTLVSFRGQDFTFEPDGYDRLLREADHLHFISAHLLEAARARGYPGGKHTLIFPMVDTDFFSPIVGEGGRPSHEGGFSVFTAARFEWTKGWDCALHAIALLAERGLDVRYDVAGEGSLKPAVVFAVHQMGLAERVTLHGWLGPERVREMMRGADAYLLASVEEAFNNSVLQAQACGCPVVCSDAGGLPENVEHGVTGFVVPRRDAWALADALERLARDPALRSRMGRAARRRAVERFSLRAGVRSFVNLYSSLAGEEGP